MKFGDNIWPACLPVYQNETVSEFQIAGFGFTDNRSEDLGFTSGHFFFNFFLDIFNLLSPIDDGGKASDWLLKAGVEEIPAEECHTNYSQSFKNVAPSGLPNWVEETQLCAKNRTSRSNTCQGRYLLKIMVN